MRTKSIYGWRGANMQNILDFEKDYPDAATILLEQNYRSTQTILNAANQVIKNNRNRPDKNLWTENHDGEKITYYRGIVNEMKRDLSSVKCKNKLQKRTVNSVILRYCIGPMPSHGSLKKCFKSQRSYTMVGGRNSMTAKKSVIFWPIYRRSPIRDSISLERIINVPKRGIGATSVEKLRAFANLHEWSLLEAAMNVELANISGKAGKELGSFGMMMDDFAQMVPYLSVTELTKKY